MAPKWQSKKLPYWIQRGVQLSFKGIIFPLVSFVSFGILLTFVFVLYKPSTGPSKAMRIGWQEWDQVYLGSEDVYSPTPSTGKEGDQDDDSTDWWNADQEDPDPYSAASLPLDEWLPLQVHDTGVTEVAVEKCFIDHRFGFCYPRTTAEEDSRKGKWTLVERDVQAKNGIYYISFYYRRTRRLDVPLVTEFMLLGNNDEPPRDRTSWRKAPHSIREGVMGQPPLFLWYKLGKTRMQMTDSDLNNIITEIDVINGDGPPFWGFEKISTPLSKGRNGQTEDVYMTYRKGVKHPPRAHPLHFNHHGHFKIMQIADLHFSVSHGRCKDTDHTPCEYGDDETLALMNRTLDLEKPDLVVFSGDQLNGQDTSWDPRSVLAKFAQPVIQRAIPWAAVLGNHDDQDDMLTRTEQVKILRAMPYSLTQLGPADVHGASNYVLPVRSPDPSRTQLMTLYFIDSGGYSAGVFDWFGFTPTEYDYIRQTQIDWFLGESERAPMLERPFHPDGGRDIGHVWGRREIRGRGVMGRKPREEEDERRRLVKPTGMMFYHIPIPETYNPPDVDPVSMERLDVGEQLDPPGNPKKNKGFFEKGLLQAFEDDFGGREVKVVANGHSHLSNNCRRIKGIWFCFNGGSSYSGYGKVGVDRRFRVFNVTEWGERIETYERTEHGEIVDRLVLVGTGAATPYVGP